ncbi:hypothetical protein ACJIZ3_019750 [Penstemon smallii]|uniref:Uncharacterized protein n=1 Tax=Penstemon smallii TaxID=265156 RepID=A0ABD3T2R3_9LAMI
MATATNFLLLKPNLLKWNQCHPPYHPVIQHYSSVKNNSSFIPLKIYYNANFKGALSVKSTRGLSPCKEDLKYSLEVLAERFVKSLRKPVAGAIFVGLLFFMYDPANSSVWAASGGRMGGSSFSSSSSSRSSSSSSSSSRSASSSSRSSSRSAEDELYFMGIYMGTTLIICWLQANDTRNTVLKLQVGLSGLRSCSLKKDLNRIAEIVDSSTSEGRQYVLTETILALLNYHDHRIYAHSSVDVEETEYLTELRFEKLSIEEREKFDEESFVNLNNINKKKKKRSTKLRTSSIGISNDEYIVVTILVSAEGGYKHYDLPLLPACINNSKDLKEALLKLATIHHSRKILISDPSRAVEVLWTPRDEDDTLSEGEFLEDYPLLKPVL